MIPVKLSNEVFCEYIYNVDAVYQAATPEQFAKGSAWYPVANDLADMIGYGDVRKGAGVIAALSANKSWSETMRLAVDAAEGSVHGHVGDALRKVRRILDGERPEEVLPMDSKTGQFYRCIADPTDPSAVVVDRHAHDVAVGEIYGNAERGLSSKGRYQTLANVYLTLAELRGVIPSTLQAITWVAHIERKSA